MRAATNITPNEQSLRPRKLKGNGEPPNSIYFGLKHQFDQLWMSEPKLNFECHC